MATAVTGPAAGDLTPADIKPWSVERHDRAEQAAEGPPQGHRPNQNSGLDPQPYDAAVVTAVGEKLGWTVNTIVAATPDAAGGARCGASGDSRQARCHHHAGHARDLRRSGSWTDAKKQGIKTVEIYGNENFGPTDDGSTFYRPQGSG